MTTRRLRFWCELKVGDYNFVTHRLRFYVTTRMGTSYVTRRVRFSTNVNLPTPITRRIRFKTQAAISHVTADTWSELFNDVSQSFIADGKGSILNEHLKFVEITNSGITIAPGFLYNDYNEYFIYGDNLNIYPIGTGVNYTLSKSLYELDSNVPFSISSVEPTDRFVQTYNPSNSGDTYRKVVDLSSYVDSIDGESAYTFAIGVKDYTMEEDDNNYYLEFYPTSSGEKWLVSSSGNVTIPIPSPTEIAEPLNGFLCVVPDTGIMINKESLNIYYPNKQYLYGDTVPICLSVRGTQGEFVSNYPFIINGVNYVCNEYGILNTSVVVNSFIHVSTNSGALPATIDPNSYMFNKYLIQIEAIKAKYERMLL